MIPYREREKKFRKISKRKKWIIEGAYSKSWTEPIIKNADLVILLDVKISTSKKRIIWRYIKRKLKKITRDKETLKGMLELLKTLNRKDLVNKRTKAMAKKYKNSNA